jgi:alkylated DNA repair dioxygenase AlkB
MLFNNLIKSLAWQEESIFVFGKHIKVPRLTCWYGDSCSRYCYSGVDHTPLPWTTELLAIREKIQKSCGEQFNSVLGNLYRNGNDSMGCHADDEKELGINPVIASLSLGDERVLRVYEKCNKKNTLGIPLKHGDLLIMAGTFQTKWLHSIPKTKKPKLARINLTFRKILI